MQQHLARVRGDAQQTRRRGIHGEDGGLTDGLGLLRIERGVRRAVVLQQPVPETVDPQGVAALPVLPP